MDSIFMYSVYIQIDADNNITAINSSAFLTEMDGWIKIDEGIGDKYHHAQGNYFSSPLMNMAGVHQYRYINGEVFAKTPEEIEAETLQRHSVIPTLEERQAALERAFMELAGEFYG